MNDETGNVRAAGAGKSALPFSVRLAGVIWIMVGGFLLVNVSTILWRMQYSSSPESSVDRLIVPELAIASILMAGLMGVGISTVLGKTLPTSKLGASSILSGCFGVCSSVVLYFLIAEAEVSAHWPWEYNIPNVGLIVAGMLANGQRKA